MSDIHVLQSEPAGNRVRLAFHIPIPDAENEVGFNYRTALTQYLKQTDEDGILESEVPFIGAAELVEIQNGAIYEATRTIQFPAQLSNAQKLTRITNFYSDTKDDILAEMQARLKFWGHAIST